jgi:hypothetical protein
MLDTEPWDVATTRDRRASDLCGPQSAFATMEEMRYADELRRQLRARLLHHAPPTGPWSVGVD